MRQNKGCILLFLIKILPERISRHLHFWNTETHEKKKIFNKIRKKTPGFPIILTKAVVVLTNIVFHKTFPRIPVPIYRVFREMKLKRSRCQRKVCAYMLLLLPNPVLPDPNRFSWFQLDCYFYCFSLYKHLKRIFFSFVFLFSQKVKSLVGLNVETANLHFNFVAGVLINTRWAWNTDTFYTA